MVETSFVKTNDKHIKFLRVGLTDGWLLGFVVGFNVGVLVGVTDGWRLGIVVGLNVGFLVGLDVGFLVGFSALEWSPLKKYDKKMYVIFVKDTINVKIAICRDYEYHNKNNTKILLLYIFLILELCTYSAGSTLIIFLCFIYWLAGRRANVVCSLFGYAD